MIDNLQLYEIIGTVAGDDTVIAVMREGVRKEDFIKSIIMKIPEIKNKLKTLKLR